MVVHEMMRRNPQKRMCAECGETVTVSHDSPEQVDDHHAVAYSSGSGEITSQTYATYIFCSITCMKEWTDEYFQRMLEDESESKKPALKTEG